MTALVQIARVIAVVALLGAAAAIATPRGRLPLALRGVLRTLGRKYDPPATARVSAKKRTVAFLLVIAAVALAII